MGTECQSPMQCFRDHDSPREAVETWKSSLSQTPLRIGKLLLKHVSSKVCLPSSAIRKVGSPRLEKCYRSRLTERLAPRRKGYLLSTSARFYYIVDGNQGNQIRLPSHTPAVSSQYVHTGGPLAQGGGLGGPWPPPMAKIFVWR